MVAVYVGQASLEFLLVWDTLKKWTPEGGWLKPEPLNRSSEFLMVSAD